VNNKSKYTGWGLPVFDQQLVEEVIEKMK